MFIVVDGNNERKITWKTCNENIVWNECVSNSNWWILFICSWFGYTRKLLNTVCCSMLSTYIWKITWDCIINKEHRHSTRSNRQYTVHCIKFLHVQLLNFLHSFFSHFHLFCIIQMVFCLVLFSFAMHRNAFRCQYLRILLCRRRIHSINEMKWKIGKQKIISETIVSASIVRCHHVLIFYSVGFLCRLQLTLFTVLSLIFRLLFVHYYWIFFYVIFSSHFLHIVFFYSSNEFTKCVNCKGGLRQQNKNSTMLILSSFSVPSSWNYFIFLLLHSSGNFIRPHQWRILPILQFYFIILSKRIFKQRNLSVSVSALPTTKKLKCEKSTKFSDRLPFFDVTSTFKWHIKNNCLSSFCRDFPRRFSSTKRITIGSTMKKKKPTEATSFWHSLFSVDFLFGWMRDTQNGNSMLCRCCHRRKIYAF